MKREGSGVYSFVKALMCESEESASIKTHTMEKEVRQTYLKFLTQWRMLLADLGTYWSDF